MRGKTPFDFLICRISAETMGRNSHTNTIHGPALFCPLASIYISTPDHDVLLFKSNFNEWQKVSVSN